MDTRGRGRIGRRCDFCDGYLAEGASKVTQENFNFNPTPTLKDITYLCGSCAKEFTSFVEEKKARKLSCYDCGKVFSKRDGSFLISFYEEEKEGILGIIGTARFCPLCAGKILDQAYPENVEVDFERERDRERN